MKIILNKCFGGFGFSPKVYVEYAKRKGIDLFVYDEKHSNKSMFDYETTYFKVPLEQITFDNYAFASVNVNNRLFMPHFCTMDLGDSFSNKDKQKYNALNKHSLYLNEHYRTDEVLISIVEDLGSEANGKFADLKIVEIPDDLDYVIDDYDGIETLHQNVPTW